MLVIIEHMFLKVPNILRLIFRHLFFFFDTYRFRLKTVFLKLNLSNIYLDNS